MPTARHAAAAVSYQQFLVVAGGYDQSGSDLNTVNILNSSTKQWVTAAPLPTVCYQLSPALVGDTLNNSLLAVGGRDDRDKERSAIYHYNPHSKRWTKVGDVPAALSLCACTALPSGELMVLGGWHKSRYFNKVHIANSY